MEFAPANPLPESQQQPKKAELRTTLPALPALSEMKHQVMMRIGDLVEGATRQYTWNGYSDLLKEARKQECDYKNSSVLRKLVISPPSSPTTPEKFNPVISFRDLIAQITDATFELIYPHCELLKKEGLIVMDDIGPWQAGWVERGIWLTESGKEYIKKALSESASIK